MSKDIIHVYFMPGMAANPSIFEHIRLPENTFKIHYLEWIIPLDKENLSDYAKRMSLIIKHENAVLIGVSFGGILVQEMSLFLKLRKIIIISSVKTRFELPMRMKIARLTQLYKLIPTRLANNVDALAKYAFGKTVTKRLELYKMYLSVSNKNYLDWAIEKIICWDRTKQIPNVLHIHGNNDAIFPIKYISNVQVVEGGTHIMILNKYKWFNENLPNLILE